MYHDKQPSLRFIKRFDGLTLLDAADEHQLRIQQIASAKSLLDDARAVGGLYLAAMREVDKVTHIYSISPF